LKKDRLKLTLDDFKEAAIRMGEARFYNGYKPGAKWRDVIDLLAWAKRRLGADILVVDHIHFLTRSEKDETRAQSEALRALKDIALEYRVIVIVVGQPSKPTQNRRGREATSQDAKGTEAFGSDASAVFILHRNRKPPDAPKIDGEDDIFESKTKVKLDYAREAEGKVTYQEFKGRTCSFYSIIQEL
jgi:replicative DNA helicase